MCVKHFGSPNEDHRYICVRLQQWFVCILYASGSLYTNFIDPLYTGTVATRFKRLRKILSSKDVYQEPYVGAEWEGS